MPARKRFVAMILTKFEETMWPSAVNRPSAARTPLWYATVVKKSPPADRYYASFVGGREGSFTEPCCLPRPYGNRQVSGPLWRSDHQRAELLKRPKIIWHFAKDFIVDRANHCVPGFVHPKHGFCHQVTTYRLGDILRAQSAVVGRFLPLSCDA